MTRAFTTLIVLAAAAGGVWWFLQDRSSAPVEEIEAPEERPAHKQPSLVGGGNPRQTSEQEPEAAPVLPSGHARIEAVVVDPKGLPIAGVPVALRRITIRRNGRSEDGGLRAVLSNRDAPGPALMTTTSDSEGRLRFDGLDPITYFGLDAAPPAPFSPARFSAYARATWPRPVQILVVPGTPLAVRLVDADGRGRAGLVQLRLQLADWAGTQVRYWYTGWRMSGANGTLRFERIPAGTFDLQAVLPGHGKRTGVLVRTPTDTEVVVRLGVEPGAVVHGTVQDEDGKPVAGATIALQSGASYDCLHSRMTQSAEDGTYRVAGLSPGTLYVTECTYEGFVDVRVPRGTHSVTIDAPLKLDFVLRRGVWLEGSVQTTAGEPLARARIKAIVLGTSSAYTAVSHAEATGRYRLGPVPSGRALVTPYAEGFAPTNAGEEGLSTMRGTGYRVLIGAVGPLAIDLTMTPCAPVGGVVLDASGRPVPGVEVMALGSFESFDLPVGGTDGEGRFAFGLPEAPTYQVRIKTATRTVHIFDLQPGTDNELRLPAIGVVQGRVAWMEPPTGRFVVHAESESGTKQQVPVGVDGAFRFAGLETGRWSIFFRDLFRERVGRSVDVHVSADARVDDVVLEPPGLLTLGGVFLDAQGLPRSTQNIRIGRESDAKPTRSVRTARDGRFRFVGLAPGRYRLFHEELAEPVLVDAGDTDVRLVAAPRRVFRGTVTMTDGTPVPRATLTIAEPHRGPATVPVIDGAFTHETQTQVTPELHVTLQRAEDADGNRISVMPFSESLPADHVATIRLTPARRATITVVDEKGKGVAGVYVMVFDRSTRARHESLRKPISTDANGDCEVFSLPEHAISIHLQPSPAYLRPKPTPLPGGQGTLRIVLRAGGAVRGEIVGPDGAPVRQAHIDFGDGKGFRMSSQADAQGQFTIGSLPVGTTGQVRVYADGAGLAPATVDNVRVGTRELRIQLVRAGALKGRVVDPDGNPVATRVRAWVNKDDGSGSAEFQASGADGTFEFPSLRAGQAYSLQARPASGWAASATVQVTPPADEILLQMTAGPRVEGRVEGDNVKGLRVTLARAATPDMVSIEFAQVGADGTFAIASANEGRPALLYVLDHRGGRYAVLDGVKAPRAGIVLKLIPAQSIAGRVENLPLDARFAGITAYSGALQLQAIAKPDGTFVLPCVPPGTYALRAFAQGADPIQIPDVAAGTTDLVIRFPEKK